MINQLVLGTVQFGLAYGVTNNTGQTPPSEIKRILDLCLASGVEVLDTSRLYGSSEERLGECPTSQDFRVVSKVRALEADTVLTQVRKSLDLLKRKSLYGLLVHNYDSYQASPKMYEGLHEAKRLGLCEKIGFSLYNADELNDVLSNEEVDVVQVPVNALDKRILPALERAKTLGVEVHARSPFLQGLLATADPILPENLAPLAPARDRYLAWASAHQLSPLQAALRLPLSCPLIDYVVLGVNSLQQAQGVIAAVQSIPATKVGWPDFDAPSFFLNPANWAS